MADNFPANSFRFRVSPAGIAILEAYAFPIHLFARPSLRLLRGFNLPKYSLPSCDDEHCKVSAITKKKLYLISLSEVFFFVRWCLIGSVSLYKDFYLQKNFEILKKTSVIRKDNSIASVTCFVSLSRGSLNCSYNVGARCFI